MTIIIGSGQERIEEAIKIIEGYCSKQINCTGCAYYYPKIEACLFQQEKCPEDWEIVREDLEAKEAEKK